MDDAKLWRSHSTNNVSVRSIPLPITRGVPQGSVLGLVLFILLTNDFPGYIQDDSVATTMYADDTTLLVKSSTAEGLYANMLAALNKTLQYCEKIDLAINPTKTTQVNFSTKKHGTRYNQRNPCKIPWNNDGQFI